jgi:hypothetical protein
MGFFSKLFGRSDQGEAAIIDLIKHVDHIKAKDKIARTLQRANEEAASQVNQMLYHPDFHKVMVAYLDNPCEQTAYDLIKVFPAAIPMLELARKC